MKHRTQLRKRCARLRKDESGAVMIIAAFGLVLFLAVTSLVTDLGLRYYQKSRLQNAMDAAALASVTYLPDKVRAKQVALEYVEKNGFSIDSVVVEFPQEGIVRVTDTYVCKTLFAGIFSEENMVIRAHAAAKYIQKNLSIDFDYLMFHGDDCTFDLKGDLREVAGSVFGNGNIRVACNDSAQIDSIVSAKNIVFANNMSTKPTVIEQAAHQDMPDWDEMIMSVAPTAEQEQFTTAHSHITDAQQYKYIFNGDKYLNNIVAYADGGVLCRGSLNTNYNNTAVLYVRGDLYVEKNFTPQCPVYVSGNVYVGGDFSPAWGMNVYVGGKMYVQGTANLQGATTVGDAFYVGKDLILRNGNGTGYNFGKIHCMGDFTSETAWGANVTIKGSMFVFGKLALGGGRNIITGNIYVWGNTYSNSDTVCFINGYMNLKGDVWCNRGVIAFGGNGDCVIHGFLYSGGSIETRSGGDISLNGCMIAEGDIHIRGASHTYNDDGATLSLYSRKGNVELGSQGTALRMWGIVYAPKGDIKISTNGLCIYGSLVGNTITCNIGSGFYIGQNDRTLPFAKTVRSAALVE